VINHHSSTNCQLSLIITSHSLISNQQLLSINHQAPIINQNKKYQATNCYYEDYYYYDDDDVRLLATLQIFIYPMDSYSSMFIH